MTFDGTSLIPLLRGGAENKDALVIGEYLGEGTIEPMRMVRKGRHKLITVNGYPPQFYDLREDPEESVNLAGRPQYATAQKELQKVADEEWNGPGLKKAVIRDQKERLMVRSMAEKWDYEAGATGPYLRQPGIRN
jgi:choline-sulfatase